MTTRRRAPILALTALALALTAAPASATTFCVPSFHPACPNNGTNVAQASLETALNTNGYDGIADRVLIAPSIVTDPDTLEASGTDALEIAGSGPADTVLTSSDNGNQFVVNLDTRAASVTLRDLRITVPASFPDGLGAGLLVRKASVENVDIESRNVGGDGVMFSGGGSYRGGTIAGVAGGSIDDGITTNAVKTGPLTVERVTIESPTWGLNVQLAGVPVTLNRVTITDPLAYGVSVSDGGSVAIRDSLITSHTGYAFSVRSGPSGVASLSARNVTVVGIGAVPNAAIESKVWNTVGHKNTTVSVSDSIIRGYPKSFSRAATANGVGVGDAFIAFDHTIVKQSGESTGDGDVTYGAGVSDVDPLFVNDAAGDYRLKAGSPAIDQADAVVAVVAGDLDLPGALRQVDGNGDGVPGRDLGAYEFQPPPPAVQPADPGGSAPPPPGPVTPGGTATDTTRPVITGLRLRRAFRARSGGRVQLTLSEAAKVTLTFTAVDKRARPRTVRRTFTARTGANLLKIKAGALKGRRYRLSAVAVDAAGNRSAAAVRKVRVPR